MNTKPKLLVTVCIILFIFIQLKFSSEVKYLFIEEINTKAGWKIEYGHNPNGCHYLNPILARIENNTILAGYVIIKSGLKFQVSDDKSQNLITTGDDTVLIQPGTKMVLPLAAMCIEPHDGAGRPGMTYTYMGKAEPDISRIAGLISVKNYQTSAGQTAIWAMIEKDKNFKIYSNKQTEMLDLTRALEKEFNLPQKKLSELLDGNNVYYSPPSFKVRYWGEFSFKNNSESDLRLGLFNRRGIQVRELYNNPHHKKGISAISFAFDMAEYTDSLYNLVLVRDNNIVSRTALRPYER